MTSNLPSNLQAFPQHKILRSQAQIKKLLLKRQYTRSFEFSLEDQLGKLTSKKLTKLSLKHSLKLKNPPLGDMINNKNLGKSIRGLQIRPEDSSRYITQIIKRFYRLDSFVIRDEKDSFTPIRIKKRVQPLRLLKTFVYDHEFCREFMRCAIYAKTLKIRKTSLNFELLKKFKNLQDFYLILK